MPPRILVPILAHALIAGALACGDGDHSATAGPSPVAADSPPEFVAGLRRGDVTSVLTALDQGHEHTRDLVGPHRIEIRSHFSLTPEGQASTAEPKRDERRPVPQDVDDHLTLVWAPQGPHDVRFTLTQANNHERKREIVVRDQLLYSLQGPRGWVVQPLQSDLWQLWLDDAYRGPRDVLQLAAPRLALTSETRAGAGLEGGDALFLRLGHSPTLTDAPADLAGNQAWRKEADLTQIAGELVLDAASGQWLSAELRVEYTLAGPQGRPLRGLVTLVAKLEVVSDPASQIPIPQGAQPLAERTRYETEQAELLDGLARP